MRGDVYRVSAPKGRRGHEQDGPRYAVVVQTDDLPLSTVIVAPTSTSCRPASFRAEIDVAGRATRVMFDQLMTVDGSRLGAPVGSLSHDELRAAESALRVVLDLT